MPQPKQKPYLTYALDANGKLIHVDCVSTGLACKCFCPHCKSELVAKNGGNRKVHHFAHANGSDCVGTIESALHKMAKDILQEHKLLMLPPVLQNRIDTQKTFEKVKIEIFDKELSLRPDCIGYTESGQFVWVEFKRTHEVDVKKAGKIISARIDCVEIDLNSCELDPAKVKSFIENSSEGRKWIYNHENPQAFLIGDNNSNTQYHNFDDEWSFEQKMSRHIAVDEQRLTRQSPWQGLTKHQRYPIEKERNVPYPTQLASKSLQLGIERFCRCVGSARNEVIEYFVLVGLNGVSDSLYFSQCGFRNLVIPFVEPCPGRVFCKTLALEYAP